VGVAVLWSQTWEVADGPAWQRARGAVYRVSIHDPVVVNTASERGRHGVRNVKPLACGVHDHRVVDAYSIDRAARALPCRTVLPRPECDWRVAKRQDSKSLLLAWIEEGDEFDNDSSKRVDTVYET
jgi:hypothetical protein